MITTEGEQRIRLLPEHLINQIAAGEVILRPASVIKELGENALDAEASQITFWTEAGGKARIQVSDNGIGMSAIDAELCFERHATSKIYSLKDLYRLRTKGFRGEALASIAAVAEVELFTRRAQDTLGTYVRFAFGKKERVEPVRCAPGTTLIVRKLFHRLPARRKSLRQEETEHRYNLQEFLRLAYPHPERHFRFYHNHTLVYDLPPTSRLERILALHPRLTADMLIPLSEETPFFRIEGYLLAPEHTPARNKENYLFLNSRYIRHIGLQQTIHHTYESLLPAETRPLYWLFLEISPEKVDVNISPSKTEVRLLEEMEIRRALTSVLRRALAVGKVSSAGITTPPPISLPSSSLFYPSEKLSASALQPSLPLNETKSAPPAFLLLYERYLILRKGETTWLMDAVRAYQRILYEKYLRSTGSSQGLLFPLHTPITPLQAAQLQAHLPLLEQHGIRLEVREGKEAVLHGIPAGFSPASASALLEEVLRLVEEEVPPTLWRESLALHLAHQGIPRLPQTLTPEAVENLWEELHATSQPFYSPSGHKILQELRLQDIERIFAD